VKLALPRLLLARRGEEWGWGWVRGKEDRPAMRVTIPETKPRRVGVIVKMMFCSTAPVAFVSFVGGESTWIVEGFVFPYY
jgi:hypothetical protein